MTIFMLHFACTPPGTIKENEKWMADCCAISSNIEQAEECSRDSIESRGYTAGELIAFSEHAESDVAAFSELEATLYLKAQQRRPPCAVIFSEWNEAVRK